MNMQAILKQAQNMQKEITNAQKEINEMEFTGKNGLVTVIVKGTRNIKSIRIEEDEDIKEDLSILEDMLTIAINKLLPGIGEKTAERLAFAVLRFSEEECDKFSKNIENSKKNIHPCKKCGTLTDEEVCSICKDKTRTKDTLIVVEDSKDVFLFEKIGNFKGYYHVLGGLISPLDDIGPNDIEIKSLVEKIEKDNIKEIILAIKSGIEADTTSLYLKKILENKNVSITKIASGIPIGGDLDYVDSLTLESAIKNRKEVL